MGKLETSSEDIRPDAIKLDGSLWSIEINNGTSRVNDTSDWAAISSRGHNVAIKNDGSLWSWGENFSGQLGDGTTVAKLSPVRIGSANTWVEVGAGDLSSIALMRDGSLWAWGSNTFGQLGIGSNGSSTSYLIPTRIGNGNSWAKVSVGEYHTVAIMRDGSLWAWGQNSSGQLGIGNLTNKSSPQRIGIDNDWAQISVGTQRTMGLKNDGSLWGWGSNNGGALGDGTEPSTKIPKRIGNATDWVEISAGDYHTLARKSDGSLWAWGDDSNGQVGNGRLSGPIGDTYDWGQPPGGNAVSFGRVDTNSHSSLTFTITNTGTFGLTGVSASLVGGASNDFQVTNQIPTFLAARGTAECTVRFAPATIGLRSTTLQIRSNSSGNYPLLIHLRGTAISPAPAIVVEQPNGNPLGSGTSSVNFGPVEVGGSVNLTFNIRNEGAANLVGVLPTIMGSGNVHYSLVKLPATVIAPNQSSTFEVSYSPSSEQATTATLSIASNSITSNPYLISLTGTGRKSLASALDTSALSWSTGGTAPWTAEATSSYDGVDAAESGVIGHSQESWMQTTVNGPGQLSFWWRVSSESGYDYLEFYINNVRQTGRISGTSGTWAQQSYALASGTNTLRWRYVKDSSTVSGSDRGWVDQVVYTSAATQAFNNSMTTDGLTAANALPAATPHNDGVKNLLKYAFNMNLAAADVRGLVPGTGTSGLPSITSTTSGATTTLRVEFIRRIGSGLVYTPKRSSTLLAGSWVALSDTPDVTPIDATWERVVYEEPLTTSTNPVCFGIVEVILP